MLLWGKRNTIVIILITTLIVASHDIVTNSFRDVQNSFMRFLKLINLASLGECCYSFIRDLLWTGLFSADE